MIPDQSLDDLARNGLETASPPALIPRQTAPDNAEFPVHQWWSWITPAHLFYIRSHFPVPRLDPAAWRLTVDGEVEQPLSLSLDDLGQLPRRRLIATLECAGNRRTEFEPPPPGVPWQDGAVSSAQWEGVALADVLAMVRPRSTAQDLLLEGADEGTVASADTPIRFARSLPLARALHPDTLLADRMNGQPLSPEHGAPLRAVAPGAYGMDSVKWLARIELLARPFEGYFQAKDYRLFPATPDVAPAPLVGPIRTNSLIAWPGPGTELRAGEEVRVVGYAWTGSGSIRTVELSADGGSSWRAAQLVGPEAPYAWRLWETRWRPETPGAYLLKVRAVDSHDGTQPEQAEWNAKGYANNGLHRVEVNVR
jgi:DMSO/TMAO reductase YedYZ molybdopterin-dependent catalytic subunit